jgi:hypothetical protein
MKSSEFPKNSHSDYMMQRLPTPPVRSHDHTSVGIETRLLTLIEWCTNAEISLPIHTFANGNSNHQAE